MKSMVASFALLGAILVYSYSAPALAQTAERLSRPLPESTMGCDGKLVVSRSATMGNLVVDSYSNFGRRIFASDADRDVMANALKPYMCDRRGVGAFVARQVAIALTGTGENERARLKSRDAASLTELSITLVAAFDGVSADAIRSDEALEPGVYHDAINALRVALDICNFFGQERRL